jgi:hypothetical protein
MHTAGKIGRFKLVGWRAAVECGETCQPRRRSIYCEITDGEATDWDAIDWDAAGRGLL